MPEYWQQIVSCNDCSTTTLTRAQSAQCEGCNNTYCDSCFDSHSMHCRYRDCEECGEVITVAAFDNGDYYNCDSCGSYNCDDCGSCSCCDNDYGDSGGCDCPSCRRNRRNGNDYDTSRVHGWQYRPSTFRPKGNYPTEVLMGVELEVGRYARDIIPTVFHADPNEDHLYLKTDGSISGLEIVTHPMTLGWARRWQAGQPVAEVTADAPACHGGAETAFTAMLAGLRSAGCHVDNGYGLHVHVSRNAFRSLPKQLTYRQAAERGLIAPLRERDMHYGDMPWKSRQSPTHQMAWLLFLMRNSDHIDNPRQLARRDCSEWGSFGDVGPGELKRKAYDDPTHDNRYVAINTNNEKTYELRFFASTLDPIQFWCALEFADASVEYTRNMRAKDILRGNSLSWDSFTHWVNDHNYPNLSAELARIQPSYAAIAEQRRIQREAEAERNRLYEERMQRDRERRQVRMHSIRRDEIANGTRTEWATSCGISNCDVCYPRDVFISNESF
jgi:hypothetical protein